MKGSTISNKKRLVASLLFVLTLVFLLIIRTGYIQIVKGEEYKKKALGQWTRGVPVRPKRGIIYDRNGKKLAVSVSKETIWCRPAEVKKGNERKVAKELAQILDLDEEEVYKKVTSKQNLVKIKQWVEKEETEKIMSAKLSGIEIAQDNKRYYPNKNFAAHIIGHTDIDQVGQYGVERMFNKYLTGTPGKIVKTTDAKGGQLPYNYEKLYEAKDGLNVVLTIDETIQHFAEKLALQTKTKHNAKNVSIIVMGVKDGDILAMASKPDYDPNDPREPVDKDLAEEWESLTSEKKQEKWFDMWRNFPINDTYEPGSTFKIITTASALEENLVNSHSQFYCGGKITRVKNGGSCVRPHGNQTLAEAVKNSCNVAMADISLGLGAQKFHEYIKAFGFGESTGIALTGETSGLIPQNPNGISDQTLTTLSFGYGVATTPIQLITAVSSVANGGNLMKPQIVKELVDDKGKVVNKYEPEIVRKPISKETSDKMLEILEGAVKGDAIEEDMVPGYRVGGKTGTTKKIVNGSYQSIYISSFVGVAPIEDPQIAVLVVVDEPDSAKGGYYGNLVAKPPAGELIKETLEYLNIKPTQTSGQEKPKEVIVPDVRNKTVEEAGKIILEEGLDYEMDAYYVETKDKIREQFPSPGTKVNRGSTVEIYINNRESKKEED
ncbi:sporulation specific penicillin-binding protein [Gottschalkia acidurici 9a]|uniref:Sporulation specific penicillin-binding protein n=1 Tax=Gottschalkia acidurici (strain ATCC 7906 / DSM 604 / BCRC 14475 / CIP 104303 / KCTC 5404 / NCIMB 10678 / 9a) TaxID=1128398 RepID=K0AZU6_GOTA9|nr:penicillin-binding transpeptidase domain-containing protein [Gottschalkia acidurici]AFS78307.1 sporulation specific penicillin-binding protein [Gottschalkia acidurici 9a]